MLIKLLVWLTIVGLYMWNSTALEQKTIDALPAGTPTCQNTSTSVEVCIRDAFNTMIKASVNGIPELHIPATDPVEHDKVKVEFSNEILRGKAIARGVKVYGFGNCTIYDLKYQRNGTNIKVDVYMQCPRIELIAAYRAKIHINNAKIMSRGIVNITLTEMDLHNEHLAEIYDRNNETFVRVTKLDFTPKLGHAYLDATGLVPEPALNAALLEVLNSNWRSIAMSAVPAVHSVIEPILNKYANEVLSHIPVHLLIKL